MEDNGIHSQNPYLFSKIKLISLIIFQALEARKWGKIVIFSTT